VIFVEKFFVEKFAENSVFATLSDAL